MSSSQVYRSKRQQILTHSVFCNLDGQSAAAAVLSASHCQLL